MAGVLMNEGVKLLCESRTVTDGIKLRLFKNDYIPTDADLFNSFNEADFSGYAPIDLAYGPTAATASMAQKTSGSHTFQHNGGPTSNTVRGYYITNTAGNVLYAAERFGIERTMDGGNSLLIKYTYCIDQLK